MGVLVTGTEGYIGSVLAPFLLQNGYEVVGVDTGFYKEGWLYHHPGASPMTIARDIRQIEEADLEGIQAVVHMAELSNDPLGQLAPNITYEINHKASVRLAKLARAAGVARFVYTSSCSVYGIADKDFVTEESPVKPQTPYAECKTCVERDVKELADANFSPVFLRNATAYGPSPRMRFDIVVNNLCGYAWTTKEIKMVSDGSPWRPQVHVLDVCKAILCSLCAPKETIHNQIFNVGRTDENYTVRQLAEIISKVFTGCTLSFGTPSADNRSYRVSFEKIKSQLPGFSCQWSVRQGAEQLYNIFRQIEMDDNVFQFRAFTRLKELQYLLRTGQIDARFFWTC